MSLWLWLWNSAWIVFSPAVLVEHGNQHVSHTFCSRSGARVCLKAELTMTAMPFRCTQSRCTSRSVERARLRDVRIRAYLVGDIRP
jgi:hypothetical protein